MFSEAAAIYRAGNLLVCGNANYAFSRECFMREFVKFMQQKANTTAIMDEAALRTVTLDKIDTYFRVSQSITSSEHPTKDVGDLSSHLQFSINNRVLCYPNNANGYIYDDALVASEPDYFTSDISYLAMARYLNDYMKKNKLDDEDIANDIIEILFNGTARDTAPVVPIMLAVLLLAEVKRNPVCFIPSLMLFELIRNKEKNAFGTHYAWQNCLQSPTLVTQRSDTHSFYTDYLYARMSGLPTLFSLQNNEKIALDNSQKEFINADKKYNKYKNQKSITASEMHMQYGGYFPNTHRFSYAELKAKRLEGKETLSDTKSFMIITDWLMMGGVANCIHQNYLHSKTRSPCLDERVDLLHEKVFPFMWDAFLSPHARNRLVLVESPSAKLQTQEKSSPSMRGGH